MVNNIIFYNYYTKITIYRIYLRDVFKVYTKLLITRSMPYSHGNIGLLSFLAGLGKACESETSVIKVVKTQVILIGTQPAIQWSKPIRNTQLE